MCPDLKPYSGESDDPYALPVEKLKDITIWGTVFEGKPYPLK